MITQLSEIENLFRKSKSILYPIVSVDLEIMCMRNTFLKFIYSEKATKFCEIFTLILTTVHTVKSKMKISQNFVAFSEYMNFTINKLFNNYKYVHFNTCSNILKRKKSRAVKFIK